MIIKSKSGSEHVRAEYTITRDINGIPTLETEYFQPRHHHVDPIEVHIKDSEDKYIVVINENDAVIDSNRVKLTAVHSLIYDFTGSRIYEEITQHFSIEQILGVVFNDTDYNFEVAGDRRYYAMQFDNFGGGRTRLELLNQICNRWEAEWDVVGNKVYIKDKVGVDGSENKKFRYLMNIHDSRVEFDITQGATFIKGEFGKKPEEDEEDVEDTSFELEYTHELAEQYGIRHAQPYSNENITTLETAEEYLKRRVEDTWRLTIDIDVIELESSTNEEYFLGDTVWAIDERVNLDMQTRIIKITKTYDIDDHLVSTRVILGNQSFVDYVLGASTGATEYATLEDLENEWVSLEELLIDKIAEFDDAFNRARDDMRDEFNSAINGAHDEIASAEHRMSDLISGTRSEMETEFEAEVERIEQEALAEYDRISGEITDSIGQARSEIEQDYSQAVQDARDYADSEISAKEQQYVEDWDIRDAQIQSTIEQIVGGSVDSLDSSLLEINSKLLDKLEFDDLSDLQSKLDDAIYDLESFEGTGLSDKDNVSGTEIYTDKADDSVVHVEVDGKSHQNAGSGKNLVELSESYRSILGSPISDSLELVGEVWTRENSAWGRSIFTDQTGASSDRDISKLPRLKSDTTYTFTVDQPDGYTSPGLTVALFDGNGKIIGGHEILPVTLTTPEEEVYMDLRGLGAAPVAFSNLQIKEESIEIHSLNDFDVVSSTEILTEEQLADYENKINIQLDAPLRSVGDVKDRLFRGSDGVWKIERNVEVTGTEDGTMSIVDAYTPYDAPVIEVLSEDYQDKLNNLRSFADSNYVYTTSDLQPTLHATFKGGGWYVRFKIENIEREIYKLKQGV